MASLYPIPTFRTNFARNPKEAHFPNLWKGLVGLWAPYVGVQGQTLLDLSGFRNDGVLTNMTNDNWVPGKLGWALDYIAASLNYVSIPNIVVGNSSMTSFAWFKTSTSGSFMHLVSLTNLAENHRFYWRVNGNDNKIQAIVRSGAGGSQSSITGLGSVVTNGAWHLGVFVRDTSADKIFFYLDGVDISGGGITDDSGNIQNTSTVIGRRSVFSPNAYFNGQIGFAGVYNRATLPQEIALLYAIPHAPLIPRDDLMAFLALVIPPFLVMKLGFSAKRAEIGFEAEVADINLTAEKADIIFAKVDC